jgi:hypothetical protein
LREEREREYGVMAVEEDGSREEVKLVRVVMRRMNSLLLKRKLF